MTGGAFVFAFALLVANIPTAVAQTYSCPSGFSSIGSKCIAFTSATGTWAAQKTYCESLGGWLAIVNTATDNTALVNARPSSEEFFIGLNDISVEGTYRWVDGSVVSYTAWSTGEPNNLNGDEDCIAIKINGLWNDKSCTASPSKAICETYTCPVGYVNAGGGKCLYYLTTADTWTNQKKNCENLGGTLAMVKSLKENAFIHSKKPSGTNYWIGFNDIATEGSFKWPDESSANAFTYWDSGEPNNGNGDEDCVTYWGGDRWNDYKCSNLLPAVCEVWKCPTGFTSVGGGKCIHYHDTAATWSEQKAYCETLGGWLAIVRSQADHDLLSNRRPATTSPYYIGANDIDVEGTFKWMDGTSMSYTNWATGEPSNSNNDEDCVQLSSKWNDVACSTQLRAICEVSDCPSGYSNIGGGKCISFRSTTASWNDQKTYCENNNAKLVTIRSASENSYVSGYRSSLGVETYIGLSDIATEGTFVWTDGTSPTYVNWGSGQPDNTNGNEDCGVMFANSEQWNDRTCSVTQGATCEMWKMCPAGYYGTVSTPMSLTACMPCPVGTVSSLVGALTSASCQTCSSGTYSLGGAATCTPCNAQTGRGYYVSDGTKSSCQCATGYYGSYCDIQCPAGQYWSSTTSSCQNCASGTYSSAGASVCTACNKQSGRGYYASDGLLSTCRCAAGYTGDYCDIRDCNTLLPGGSLIGLLLNANKELRDFSKNYNATKVASVLPSVRSSLKTILEQDVDMNSNDEITKEEALNALFVKSIYSKGIESLPVWCISAYGDSSCYASAVPTATVLANALTNFGSSSEHTFDGSGFSEVATLTSTYPDSSWSSADCKAYDHGLYASTAKNVITKWKTASPTTSGTYYVQTCGYINGLKSSAFTTDDVLKGRRTNFTDNIAISSDNLYKRVYCVALYYAVGCTNPPSCTSYTRLDVKTECSVGLYYVSCV